MTDGSLVPDEVTTVCFGVRESLPRYLFLLSFRVLGGHLHLLPPDLDIGSERCRFSCSVPRPLQSFQRAELWSVTLAPQCNRLAH